MLLLRIVLHGKGTSIYSPFLLLIQHLPEQIQVCFQTLRSRHLFLTFPFFSYRSLLPVPHPVDNQSTWLLYLSNAVLLMQVHHLVCLNPIINPFFLCYPVKDLKSASVHPLLLLPSWCKNAPHYVFHHNAEYKQNYTFLSMIPKIRLP